MQKYYEIVGKNLNDDWETIADEIATLKQAINKCKKINKEDWLIIDINLIVDNDLTETYDVNGKIR